MACRIESLGPKRQNQNRDGACNVKCTVTKVSSSFRSMPSIDPETRPLLGKCYMDISQPVVTDEPFIYVDEVSISGLSCTLSLRNM